MSNPTKITRKIGRNRNAARLWLEGPSLTQHGWVKGTPFLARFEPGSLSYTLEKADPPPAGVRKVAGNDERPIIDTNSDKILEALGVSIGDTVSVEITEERITVTPDKASP